MSRHIVLCYHQSPSVSRFRHLPLKRQAWTSCALYSSRSPGLKSLISRYADVLFRDVESQLTVLQDQEKLPVALQFLPATKTREPDSVLRLTHVETLLLLCSTRWCRDYLREHGVYEIVRAMHENEQVDKVCLSMVAARTPMLTSTSETDFGACRTAGKFPEEARGPGHRRRRAECCYRECGGGR